MSFAPLTRQHACGVAHLTRLGLPPGDRICHTYRDPGNPRLPTPDERAVEPTKGKTGLFLAPSSLFFGLMASAMLATAN